MCITCVCGRVGGWCSWLRVALDPALDGRLKHEYTMLTPLFDPDSVTRLCRESRNDVDPRRPNVLGMIDLFAEQGSGTAIR